MCAATSGRVCASWTWPISIVRPGTGSMARPMCAVHGTTGAVPFARLPQEPLQSTFGKPVYDTCLVSFRRATKDCYVSYAGNYYSVPAEYARKTLKLKETEDDRLLILNAQDELDHRASLAGRAPPAHRGAGPLRQHRPRSAVGQTTDGHPDHAGRRAWPARRRRPTWRPDR